MIRNAAQFKRWVEGQLEKKKVQTADKILAHLFDEILEGNPVEDGHAHEAWLTAIDQTSNFKELAAIAAKHQGKRSHDPTAKKYGKSSTKFSKHTLTVTISNLLPFVYKLEYGKRIKVGDESGNKGRKINPVKRPPEKGPLYGKRAQGNEGLLVFEKNGTLIKTKVWTPRGDDVGFVDKAIKATLSFIRSHGLTGRSRRI